MSSQSPAVMTSSAGNVTDYYEPEHKEFAFDMFKSAQRRDPNTSQRFTRKVNQLVNNYKWPLPKKNPTIEEQILSPLSKEPQLLRTDMSLNTLVEASKQIKSAMKQTQVYSPASKPITPFTVTTANLARLQTFGSPRSSIRVSNLMSNGLSYPVAKQILKKSPVVSKSPPMSRRHQSMDPMTKHAPTLHQSSIQSVENVDQDFSKNSQRDSINFRDSMRNESLTDAVQLPIIAEMPSMGVKQQGQVSVSKKVDEKSVRANSMKYYTTYIRKVNEFHVNKHRQKKANYPGKALEPTQWQKYKTYMNMFDEDDGTFPRVSELSLRFEADRLYEESKRKLQTTKEIAEQGRQQQLTQREKDKMQLLTLDQPTTRNQNLEMYFSAQEDPKVFNGIKHTDVSIENKDVSTAKAEKDSKYDTFQDFNKKQPAKRSITLHPSRGEDDPTSGEARNKNDSTSNYDPSEDAATDLKIQQFDQKKKSANDREVKDIVVNIKGQWVLQKTNTVNQLQGQRRKEEQTSRLNRKYQRIITKESETVKHLVSLIQPRMQNFDRAKREIEPYDDIDELRQVNIGQRVANLRNKIYKNRETGKVKPSPPPRRKAPPQVAVQRMVVTQENFGVRHDSQVSSYSKDLNDVITPRNVVEDGTDYLGEESQMRGKRTPAGIRRDGSMTGVNAWEEH